MERKKERKGEKEKKEKKVRKQSHFSIANQVSFFSLLRFTLYAFATSVHFIFIHRARIE